MFFLRLKLYFYKVREPHTESPASKDNHYIKTNPTNPHLFPHMFSLMYAQAKLLSMAIVCIL